MNFKNYIAQTKEGIYNYLVCLRDKLSCKFETIIVLLMIVSIFGGYAVSHQMENTFTFKVINFIFIANFIAVICIGLFMLFKAFFHKKR